MDVSEIKDGFDLVLAGTPLAQEVMCLLFPNFPGWCMGRRAQALINTFKAVNEKLRQSGLSADQRRAISLKLGIPWAEKASIEEDPILQNIWANLMANALNPNFDETSIRTAYISIIGELSVEDVRVLNYLREHAGPRWSFNRAGYGRQNPISMASLIAGAIKMSKKDVDISLNNLKRLELIDNKQNASFIVIDDSMRGADQKLRTNTQSAIAETYNYYFTELGLAFLAACLAEQ